MKRWLKITLIVLAVILLSLAVIGYYVWSTAVAPGIKLQKTLEEISPEQLLLDAEEISNGNCDKLPQLEADLTQIREDLRAGCESPILKAAIEAEKPGLCLEINNPESELEASLAELKASCA